MSKADVGGLACALVESRAPETACAVARLRDSAQNSGLFFDRQIRDRRWIPTQGTELLTSTAIGLIGLSRASVATVEVGLDLAKTRVALFSLHRKLRYPGSLGLVLWANAVTGGPQLSETIDHLGSPAIDDPSFARRLRTMEVAWLLSGLAHERYRSPSRSARVALEAAKAVLLDRFETRTRIFRHADPQSPAPLRARRWVATFADQIYPVQALALASMATGDPKALDVATRAAERIVETQGERGQWWWHHDPRDGRVSSAYPVYSVHQQGMVPMAFHTLKAAGGPDLTPAIELGRSWLQNNELGLNLIDEEAGTTWRSIERDEGRLRRLARHSAELILGGDDRRNPPTARLRVNHETRPYEWGWSLFARAIEHGSKPSEHLA